MNRGFSASSPYDSSQDYLRTVIAGWMVSSQCMHSRHLIKVLSFPSQMEFPSLGCGVHLFFTLTGNCCCCWIVFPVWDMATRHLTFWKWRYHHVACCLNVRGLDLISLLSHVLLNVFTRELISILIAWCWGTSVQWLSLSHHLPLPYC